jgi:ribosomal protein S18 acetylase RimI-like enzyme
MDIQPALATDIPALCRLLALLFAQEADFRPDTDRQQQALAMLLADPAAGRMLVCREHGAVTGMVSLLFTVSTAEGGRAAILEDLVVAPEARGKGTGTRLLRAALALARDQGCRRVTVLTDHDNAQAQALYRAHGFAASTMQVLRLHVHDTGTAG